MLSGFSGRISLCELPLLLTALTTPCGACPRQPFSVLATEVGPAYVVDLYAADTGESKDVVSARPFGLIASFPTCVVPVVKVEMALTTDACSLLMTNC